MQFQTEPWMRELNNEERQQMYNMFMKLPEKQDEDDDLFDEQEKNQEEFWIDDERIDLSRHIGSFYTTLPAFGYPTMTFHENPIERVQSGLRPINSFNDLDVVNEEVK